MNQISVCLPSYNGENYLLAALHSIETQTCKDIEVLISDDGSVDRSISIVEEFKKSSSLEIRVFKNKGLGIVNNCNFLAQKASYQYLKFLFQDDLLKPHALETFLSYIRHYDNVVLAFSDREIDYNFGASKECQDIFNGCRDLARNWSTIKECQSGIQLLEDPKLLKSPVNKVGEPSNTLILRKAFIESGGFDPQFSQLLDLELWFRLMTLGNVVYINEELSKFRVHDSQQSVVNAKENLIHEDFLKLYTKLLTSKHFTSLSEGFRMRLLEVIKPLISQRFNRNIEQNLTKAERNDYLSKINRLSRRIKFMESTFSWKLRKELLKVYYLFNSKEKKIRRPKYYNPLTFKTYGKIKFNKSSNPKVTIIIPFFQQYEITWLCLKALESNGDHHIDFEVILVDDFSSGNSDFINSLHGIQIIRNNQNLGFLKSCNEAVLSANGSYLVFLNNDTQVQKGWLSSLVEVLENNATSPGCAVGSKLIFPDNQLQEAGGIVWNDATGCNYGKGSDHNLPQYNFLREVDYCSGASLAISKAFFLELGTFNEIFAPAYFEDTDICFKIRERGGTVYYQPRSIAIHFEGMSCGKSENAGVKSYQKKNREIFSDIWRNELPHHFLPSGGFISQYRAANRLNGKKTILVIDSTLPYYDKESGGCRIYQILKILKKQSFHVIFLPANEIADEPYFSKLSLLGIEVLVDQSGKTSSTVLLKDRLELIDWAWICRPQIFEQFGCLLRQKSKARIIFDTIDLHYLRFKREWTVKGSNDRKIKKKWQRYLKIEKKFARMSDHVLTVTNDESEIVKGWNVKNVSVLPNIHIPRIDGAPSFSARDGLIFIGNYLHPPNEDAVNFLVSEVMPSVWSSIPEIQLTLLGSNPSPKVLDLVSERVSVTGFIEDVTPYFDLAKVFISPLRYGAGMKGKIGQSMSLGLPVVTTSIGAEGLYLNNGKNALIADDPFDIANSIVTLIKDEDTWTHLSNESIKSMQNFCPEIVSKEIAKLLSL